MNLANTFKDPTGAEVIFEYADADSFEHLDISKCTQVYGVCFLGDKIVVVYNGKKKTWGLVGGTIEKGETLEQTLKREIQEESNMEVLSFLPIGVQKVTNPRDKSFHYQTRYACTVKPYGPFVADPDESITEIKLINPADYRKYFDWGEIGDRIIERALERRSEPPK